MVSESPACTPSGHSTVTSPMAELSTAETALPLPAQPSLGGGPTAQGRRASDPPPTCTRAPRTRSRHARIIASMAEHMPWRVLCWLSLRKEKELLRFCQFIFSCETFSTRGRKVPLAGAIHKWAQSTTPTPPCPACGCTAGQHAELQPHALQAARCAVQLRPSPLTGSRGGAQGPEPRALQCCGNCLQLWHHVHWHRHWRHGSGRPSRRLSWHAALPVLPGHGHARSCCRALRPAGRSLAQARRGRAARRRRRGHWRPRDLRHRLDGLRVPLRRVPAVPVRRRQRAGVPRCWHE